MSLGHAILGLLSDEPLSGYDLKKKFADSTILYWSGNNNQIYSGLLQLHKEGLVSYEVHFEEGAPAKKVYSITEAGRLELKTWLLSAPEPPGFQNPFLIRLLWIHLLSPSEMYDLMTKYEEEVCLGLEMQKEIARRDLSGSNYMSSRRHFLKMIHENIVENFENELKWVRNFRKSGTIESLDEGDSKR